MAFHFHLILIAKWLLFARRFCSSAEGKTVIETLRHPQCMSHARVRLQSHAFQHSISELLVIKAFLGKIPGSVKLWKNLHLLSAHKPANSYHASFTIPQNKARDLVADTQVGSIRAVNVGWRVLSLRRTINSRYSQR